MHRVFGQKEEAKYIDRRGAYLIPVKNGYVGVVLTGKGYFLLGGGLEKDESDEICIRRECLEEAGYKVLIKYKIGSAETYCRVSEIGYFHPIQEYYVGELLEKMQDPIEDDHRFVWVRFEKLRGNMYLEMQNWALEEVWDHMNESLDHKVL